MIKFRMKPLDGANINPIIKPNINKNTTILFNIDDLLINRDIGKINADIAILNPRLKLPPSWLSLSSNPAANPD